MSEPKTITLTKLFPDDILANLIDQTKRYQVAFVQSFPVFLTSPEPITY